MKLQRSKITRSHSTSIDAARPFLELARSNPDISKISLGIIKSLRKISPRRIKCTEELACILVQIRGNRALQEIRFFTTKIPEVRKWIEQSARQLSFEVSR